MSWTNPINYSVGQSTCIAKLDEQTLDNIDFAGSHGHTGAPGDGAQLLASGSSIQGSQYNKVAYQTISLLPFFCVCAHADVQTSGGGGSDLNAYSIFHTSNGASAKYLIDMTDGTWEFQLMYTQFSTRGILAASIGSTKIGQVDTGGALAYNVLTTASRFTISASGTQTLTIEGTTGSSGGANIVYNHLLFYRVSS